jgi:hypothetical protein
MAIAKIAGTPMPTARALPEGRGGRFNELPETHLALAGIGLRPQLNCISNRVSPNRASCQSRCRLAIAPPLARYPSGGNRYLRVLFVQAAWVVLIKAQSWDHSNRVSSNGSLCFRETEFYALRLRRRNTPEKFTETPAETKLTPPDGREISSEVGMRGGAGRSPTLRRIDGLQKVRVEMDPLSGKGDFCPTRTPA